MENGNVTDFVLKGFAGGHKFHIIMFVILLLVFAVSITGNIFMIIIICSDRRLHSPMYFFLVSLSLTENCAITSVIPKLLAILITQNTSISKTGCLMQGYLYFFLFSTIFLILTVMSFGRFVAICYPLRYLSIMKNSVCVQLVIICLTISFLSLLYPVIMMSILPYCGRVLDHFFCDGAVMLKLICADISLINLSTIISSTIILIIPLILIAISYVFIIYTVLKIPSSTGRQKTFSTCISHLTMVSVVFGSAIFHELKPVRENAIERDKMINLISTIIGPFLNPFIYTLRNQKVKESIRDTIRRNMVL